MTQGRSNEPDNRVVELRPKSGLQKAQASGAHTPSPAPSPTEKLDQFERGKDEPDDFRHRMVTNALALGFVAILIASAVWLADSILTMRKKQDCGLQGRKNCVTIDAPISSR